MKRDTVTGSWKLQDKKLISSGEHEFEKFQFRQSLPAEYDFRIVFSRVSGNDSIVQVCPVGEQSIVWAIGCFGNTVMGFGEVNGAGLQSNSTTVKKQSCLENRREYTSVVKVRKNRIEAYIDDKLIAELDTSDIKLSAGPQLGLPTAAGIGLVTNKSSTEFSAVEIILPDKISAETRPAGK